MTNARRLRLYHRLQLAAHVVGKQADRRMKDAVGMTTAQVAALVVVASGTDVSQRDVAEALRVNESGVTGMVARLERLGMLTRRRDSADRRAYVLELTEDARAALAESRRAFAAVNRIIERTLSQEEIEVLVSCLDRLTTAFRAEPAAAAGAPR